MSSFLITGGAGFIGGHIAERLVNEGARVRVFDNLLSGKRENLAAFADKIEFVQDDVRDASAVKSAMKGIDYVFHEAALPSVVRSITEPHLAAAINVEGTVNILEAARIEKVKRVVFAGSSSVYGMTPTLPKSEDMKPSPLSPYAVTKLAGEHLLQVYWHIHGLPTVILRYFNVFGPRQDPESEYAAVIPKFITALHNGKRPIIYGDGAQTRDFTFVHNVVDANLIAVKKEGVEGMVFNIACGRTASLLELVESLKSIMKKNIEPKFEPERPGDIKHSYADITAATEKLGYRPKISFREGLEKTIDYYCSI